MWSWENSKVSIEITSVGLSLQISTEGLSALSETPVVLFPACTMKFPLSQQKETKRRESFVLFIFSGFDGYPASSHTQARAPPLLGSHALVSLLLLLLLLCFTRTRKQVWRISTKPNRIPQMGRTPSPVTCLPITSANPPPFTPVYTYCVVTGCVA